MVRLLKRRDKCRLCLQRWGVPGFDTKYSLKQLDQHNCCTTLNRELTPIRLLAGVCLQLFVHASCWYVFRVPSFPRRDVPRELLERHTRAVSRFRCLQYPEAVARELRPHCCISHPCMLSERHHALSRRSFVQCLEFRQRYSLTASPACYASPPQFLATAPAFHQV